MAEAACSTVHQPGRMQYPRQISQLHGSDGGYFSRSVLFDPVFFLDISFNSSGSGENDRFSTKNKLFYRHLQYIARELEVVLRFTELTQAGLAR